MRYIMLHTAVYHTNFIVLSFFLVYALFHVYPTVAYYPAPVL